MGVSIDMHVYTIWDIVKQLERDAQDWDGDVERLKTYLAEFGVVEGNTFVTLWNEYYEEYNSGYEVMRFLAVVYNVKDSSGDVYLFLGGYSTFKHTNAAEVREHFFDTEYPDND